MKKQQDWKDDLFDKDDYKWTDKEFEAWRKQSRKEVKFMVGGLQTHKGSVFSVSNIMYAHRMDGLKEAGLNPIEQTKLANVLWQEHLKRIK